MTGQQGHERRRAGQPTGNVLWLDPYTETAYLESLAEIGRIERLVREDVQTPHPKSPGWTARPAGAFTCTTG
ncbi:hypothetical protein [Paenarthrobacter aromaticivorans]|uniref:hypothetical protein n=1 Tax=Paenarthrobacter aromaticivorans TaxID=2849150 RepID=UPI003A7F8C3E